MQFVDQGKKNTKMPKKTDKPFGLREFFTFPAEMAGNEIKIKRKNTNFAISRNKKKNAVALFCANA